MDIESDVQVRANGSTCYSVLYCLYSIYTETLVSINKFRYHSMFHLKNCSLLYEIH
ncbi:hypothetical protein HanPI659440_Chr03g0122891 [Helianthus annuus]|nr:hypothetical protein HanPI659440_Chr03g0122891 [Helianthus annuus]